MAACRPGDRVLLHAEVIGINEFGPQVRVETGWGGGVYFTPAREAIARIDRKVEMPVEPTSASIGDD